MIGFLSQIAVWTVKLLILAYRYSLSLVIGRQCRFQPSCSEYTLEAVEKFGAVQGLYLGIRRIGRCRPGCDHGFDPVPSRFRWYQPHKVDEEAHDLESKAP